MSQVVHPTLGISRPDGEEPHVCSKCCHEIPDEHVPLMPWNDSGRRMWVFCEACEGPVLKGLMPGIRNAAASPRPGG